MSVILSNTTEVKADREQTIAHLEQMKFNTAVSIRRDPQCVPLAVFFRQPGGFSINIGRCGQDWLGGDSRQTQSQHFFPNAADAYDAYIEFAKNWD